MNTETDIHNGHGELCSSPGSSDNTFPCAGKRGQTRAAMDETHGFEPMVEPSINLLRAAAQ